MSHKVYDHRPEDLQSAARLTPYQVPEVDHPKRVIDWQPWTIVAIVFVMIVVSAFLRL